MSVATHSVDSFKDQIKEVLYNSNNKTNGERNLALAKSLVLCARSLFPNDLLLMHQHYEVLVQEGNFESAARVAVNIFQTNPQHELFVNLFLQILSSHLPSSPLFPPSALHIKEILSQFKLSIGYSSSSSNFSSLHSSHRIHIPERHEYVLEFLDLPTKEQMTTSCCTYFVDRKKYGLACLLYSLLINWQSPNQASPHLNQAAELALACEKQQNLPIFNPFREFLARIVSTTPSQSQTYLHAIQYHLAKCNWSDLSLLFSRLLNSLSPSLSSSSSSSSSSVAEQLAREGWSNDACAQCVALLREHAHAGDAGADATTQQGVVLALGVCVLVRNLWVYYQLIAGIAADGSHHDGMVPYALIYDIGDEVQALTVEDIPNPKKRKLKDIEPKSEVGTYPGLLMAHEIWTLLNLPKMATQFNSLWTQWGYSEKIWIHLALGDMFMHSKQPTMARTILTKVETILTNRTPANASSKSTSSSSSISSLTTSPLDALFARKLETQHDMWIDRTRLQTALCHMCESAHARNGAGDAGARNDAGDAGDAYAHVKHAAVKMLEVLVDRPFPSDSAFLPLSSPSSSPLPSTTSSSTSTTSAGSSEQEEREGEGGMRPCFVALSEQEVLLRCVSGLVWCYSRMGRAHSGHVLVLLQANWARYARSFGRIASDVLHKEGLSYDSFFDYVEHPDILEEIAYLANSGTPLSLHGSTLSQKIGGRETREELDSLDLHAKLERHLHISSTSDNMSIPAILPRFAAAEMLKLCA